MKLKVQSNFNFKWIKKDYPQKCELKVFSTFACGGGSSMGYKLSGYNVLGANDINPKMEQLYKINHNPKHYFLCDIRDLLKKNLPKELYDLDILDGSPPCSSFSMAGNRSKDWGKEKKFTEGQAKQVLDDLFFYFLDLANKLRPKIIVAENVKGILQGDAKGYVVEIIKKFKKIGYILQVFVLNSATMGVPQKRERVFFIAHRKDLKLKPLRLEFNQNPITFDKIDEGNIKRRRITSKYGLRLMKNVTKTGMLQIEKKSLGGKIGNVGFGICVLPGIVPLTIRSAGEIYYHTKKHYATDKEISLIQSFPRDYDYNGNSVQYVCGMSVPPVMMANVAEQIRLQWLQKHL